MMTLVCCVLLAGMVAVQAYVLIQASVCGQRGVQQQLLRFNFEGGYPEKLGGLGAYGGLGYGAHREGLGYGGKLNGGYLGGYGGKLDGGYLGGYGGKLDGGYLGGYGHREGSLGLGKHGGY